MVVGNELTTVIIRKPHFAHHVFFVPSGPRRGAPLVGIGNGIDVGQSLHWLSSVMVVDQIAVREEGI